MNIVALKTLIAIAEDTSDDGRMLNDTDYPMLAEAIDELRMMIVVHADFNQTKQSCYIEHSQALSHLNLARCHYTKASWRK